MLDRYVTQGRADALRRFGFTKEAIELGAGGGGGRFSAPPMPAPAPAAAAGAMGGGGFMDKAKAFGSGQLGAAKDLFGNMRQGLGGAATPELGQAARGAAMGNLKTLAPSLLAGGALYMMHRHNQAQREQQAHQQTMGGGGGYPMM